MTSLLRVRPKSFLLSLVVLFILGIFFSFRIQQVPTGFTADEVAFGYNAILLSRTMHDQNGRFLPVFVLSLGQDWRQPITQYYLTIFFKLFRPSVWTLRITSVLITLLSITLIYFTGQRLLGKKGAILSSLIFLSAPIVMIQSHLALDNIMPVPFVIGWLFLVWSYQRTNKLSYLFWAGVVLGISFYSYKGMRASAPTWSILTGLYLWFEYRLISGKWLGKQLLEELVIFSLGVIPFYLIAPILESKYPGAIFDRHQYNWDSWYSFFYPYFSSYDPSFLFIKGDELLYHSTLRHGMVLLASLPFFLIGLYQAIKKQRFWWFLVMVFFTAPLLYGFVNSVHRASRLLSMLPSYSLITALGGSWLLENKSKVINLKWLFVILSLLMVVNYLDFVNYYWFTYPKFSRELFGDLSIYQDYQILAQEAQKTGKLPFLADGISQNLETGGFLELSYFPQRLPHWDEKSELAAGSLVMSQREEIPGLVRLNLKLPHYYLHQKN